VILLAKESKQVILRRRLAGNGIAIGAFSMQSGYRARKYGPVRFQTKTISLYFEIDY